MSKKKTSDIYGSSVDLKSLRIDIIGRNPLPESITKSFSVKIDSKNGKVVLGKKNS